jgi:uncharacterized protein YprB with RNaseH-like and TPR domain
MLESYNIENILFLDIETVSNSQNYNELPERMKALWDKKAENLARNDKSLSEEEKVAEVLYSRAGIYAEFGKIICISTGIVRGGALKMKSYFGHDEKELLTEFADMLKKSGGKSFQYLCAHNGKEFDFPYMIRRMLINGIDVPHILDLAGKKPWEVNHLDTMELWKFGDFKNYTSLELLAAVFDISTPKDDIHGADVGKVYWEDGDLQRIVTYCRKDVITIVNLFLKFQMKPMIHDNEISFVES